MYAAHNTVSEGQFVNHGLCRIGYWFCVEVLLAEPLLQFEKSPELTFYQDRFI